MVKASLLALALLAACATQQSGTCKDKPLWLGCKLGTHRECETTRQGCEQCTCVPDDPFGPRLRGE